ncbi:lytic transglycosylase domain-containing protein [Candidatus Gracilibacteria bacterium]|nr:lytic transglycosylase domain-containing protein [Candidatus Gracilibacteria bacterium]
MLKNNTLLGIVYGVLFLGVILVIFLGYNKPGDDVLVFEYPNGDISFAGESVPISGVNTDVKERFDKEFLQTSSNLYQFYLYVKRYPLYIPLIEQELENAGLPDDFKYMSIAESALRNDVVSSAGAAGVWQFMPETAKRYGLEVTELVDERYHFEKATRAAMEYLGDLYEQFDDGALVAAAYNRGENGLRRDMESQGVDNYYDLYLNQETSRYVFRIIAIKYVLESYFERKDIIDKLIGGVYKKPQTTTILVSSIANLAEWSNRNGYTYKDIKNLNRWIVGESLPDGNWEITILKD